MCRRHGIPAPVTSSPATGSDLAAFAQNATFPVVVKNPFLAMRPRLSKPLAKALTAFAATLGPIMRFGCGIRFTARRVSTAVAAKAE